MQWVFSADGASLLLVAFGPSDVEARDALVALEKSRKDQGPVITGRLRDALAKYRMLVGLLEEFSKWCNTEGSYAKSQQAAERVSIAFFGLALPRLLDQVDRRVPTYEQLMTDLKTRLGVDDGTAEPKLMPPLLPEEGDTTSDDGRPYVPTDEDSRATVLRQIKERRGKHLFRGELLRRYGSKCMISGCTTIDVVDAAHIRPYRGDRDNDPRNGLLLRTDLHTLFDLNLLGIEPETLTVRIHPRAKKDGYEVYHGTKLSCGTPGPSPEAVVFRWKGFVRDGGAG